MTPATPAVATRPAPTPGRGRDRLATALLVLPATAWYVILLVLPLAFVVVFSFGTRSQIGGYGGGFTLDNYAAVLAGPGPFITSLTLAFSGTLLCLLVGLPLAYFIATRAGSRKSLFIVLLVIPFWTSFLIRTYAWLIILDPQFPLFRVVHVDLLYSRPAVYIGVAYNYLPLMVLPLYAALERIDWSLVEAAQDLGDTPLRSFRRITLPLALPGVIAGSLLVFIPLTGEYLIPAILGGNTTSYAGSLIAQQFTEVHDWPFGSAIAVVVIVTMTIVLLAFSTLANRETVTRG